MPEILLCGAEGEQFLFENELSTYGADDKRRGSVLLENGQQMYRNFGEVSDLWVHFRVAFTEIGGINQVSGTLMEIRAGSLNMFRIYAPAAETGNTCYLRVDMVPSNGSESYISGPSFPHALDEFINYDVRIRVVGNNCEVSFYRNEVLRHQITVNSGFGWDLPDSVVFNSRTNSPGEDASRYQDVIITDSLPTVGMELATLVPSAVGNYSEFSNDYTAIDDFGYNQSSVISASATGQRESWFFSDPEFDIGDKVIYALVVTTVAQLDLGETINDFRPFLRIGGTNYDGSDIGANNVAPNAYTSVFLTNPATENPWAQEELVGLESGIQSV